MAYNSATVSRLRYDGKESLVNWAISTFYSSGTLSLDEILISSMNQVKELDQKSKGCFGHPRGLESLQVLIQAINDTCDQCVLSTLNIARILGVGCWRWGDGQGWLRLAGCFVFHL